MSCWVYYPQLRSPQKLTLAAHMGRVLADLHAVSGLSPEIVGTCEKFADPGAPIWSKVHLTNVDAPDCGTLGRDPETGRVLPHVHTSLGLNFRRTNPSAYMVCP